MPVSTESLISGPFYPNGATTDFAFDFKAVSASEVVAVDADGATISTALYSVTIDSDEGGTLSFTSAPTSAAYPSIYIVGDPALTQPSDFDNTGPSFNPAALTRALDRAAIRDLRQQGEIDRAIKAPFGEAGPTLPSVADRAGLHWKWNADGSIGTADPSDFSQPASDQADRSADEADRSEAGATLSQAWATGTLPGGAGTKSSREWSIVSGDYAAQAGVIRDEATDLVDPANTFIDELLATAEAAVSVGTYFKMVDTTTGIATVRVRTSGGSDVLYQEPTVALLERTASVPVADTPADLLALTASYPVGSKLRTGDGHIYEVASALATDYDLATAGGVLLYLQRGADGFYNFAGMAPAADDTTDDYPKLRKLLDHPLPCVFIPRTDDAYYMGETINLKDDTWIRSTGTALTGNPGASLRWDEDKDGIIINRNNTLGRTTVASSGAADGSIIEGITLLGAYTVGGAFYSRGITMRARAILQNCVAFGFGESGAHVLASSGAGGANEGNANLFRIYNCRFQNNYDWGLYIDGADANAGIALGCSLVANGRAGVYDSSFLGNKHDGHHASENGLVRSTCSFGGNRYETVAFATDADLVNTTPGTNEAVWRFKTTGGAGTGQYPLWTAAQPAGTWRWGAAYVSDNANARSLWTECYSEGGQPSSQFAVNDVVVNGLHGAGVIPTGATLLINGTATFSALTATSGKFSASGSTIADVLTIRNGGSFSATRGAGIVFQVGSSTAPNIIGRFSAVCGTGLSTNRTSAQVEIYNGGTPGYESAMEWRGNVQDIVPGGDNLWDLGDASRRYKVVYAGAGTINTSDEREKEQIAAIPDEWLDAWGDVQWSRFKWKDAVAERGEEARWHTGLIAQQVRDAFDAHGLDATELGLLCYDEWEDEFAPVLDDEGNDTGETRLVTKAGNRWGVRYEEAQAMEAAWMRRALTRLSA